MGFQEFAGDLVEGFDKVLYGGLARIFHVSDASRDFNAKERGSNGPRKPSLVSCVPFYRTGLGTNQPLGKA